MTSFIDPISSTTTLLKLLTDSTSTIVRTVINIRTWCLSIVGPLVISVLVTALFLLFSSRQYAVLEESKNGNAWMREERGKNNEMKRRAIWELMIQVRPIVKSALRDGDTDIFYPG